jgi:hypothetical protein
MDSMSTRQASALLIGGDVNQGGRSLPRRHGGANSIVISQPKYEHQSVMTVAIVSVYLRSILWCQEELLRMAKSFLSVMILTFIIGCGAIPAFAQAVRVPGTKVSLIPPAGFSFAQQYPGFERPAEQATIMVTELPGAAADMIRAMSKQALASRGMILIAAQDEVINGRQARLLQVRQKAANGDVLKWMLIAGDATTTIMIVGTFPAAGALVTGTAIQQSLLSTSWASGAPPNAFEGLPFRVTPTARLKLARRVSNMLMFTESGTMGSAGSSEALYVVGHSIGQGSLGDLRSFSETRAKETTLTKGVGNFVGRMLQVDGLNAYELEADASDARSGTLMRLYQVVIPDDTGYFILQGLSRADRAGELVSEFRKITASFRRDSSR